MNCTFRDPGSQLCLNTTNTRRLLVVLQANQHLPHPLLAATLTTTNLSFPTQINQLSDPLPTCTASSGIFSLGQEFLCLLCSLSLLSIDFAIVGFVETIDIFLGCGNGFLLFGGGSFVSASNISIPLFAPGADWFGVFLR